MTAAGLVVQDLSLCLGHHRVVQDVDLRVAPGTSLALMGPNGSGKSTLLRALAGLMPTESGKALLDGTAIGGLPATRRARSIACVFQHNHVAFDFTLGELVALGAENLGREPVRHALRRVGLPQHMDRASSRCSGGERQRAHIARALVSRARLLLLDEPDNHLDLGGRYLLCRLLRQESASGAVVVFATHDLDLAASADQLLVLDAGHTVLNGPPTAVMADPRFFSTFGLPTDLRWADRPTGHTAS